MDDLRKGEIWHEACGANNHNRRIIRGDEKGVWKSNPYSSDTEEHLIWNEAYNYRGMINDG